MSSFLYRLGRTCFQHRLRVVAVWVLLLILVGVGILSTGWKFADDFEIPGADAQVALDRLEVTIPQAADPIATLIITAPEGTRLDTAESQAEIEDYFASLVELDYVKGVISPYTEQLKGMITDDGRYAMASIRVAVPMAAFTDEMREELAEHAETVGDFLPGAKANIGGNVYSINMPKLTWVECIGLVVAIVVLIATLGSFWGMSIPIATALAGVGLGAGMILISTSLMTVNSTTPVLSVMLGLAVGIDYALFIVSRHRDQLATGMQVEESTARAIGTAGSAVVFAGSTVIIALVGLSVVNLPFLTIMGCMSALTVAFGVCLALTLLPAMLGFYGERLRPKQPKPAEQAKTESRWNPAKWWVTVVTKVPLLWCALVLVALGALSLPAANLEMSLPNSGQSELGARDRTTFDLIKEHFGVGYNGALVVTFDIVELDDPMAPVDGIKADIEAMPGVKLVSMATPNENVDTAMLQVIPETAPDDPATSDLVHRINDRKAEWQQRYDVTIATTGYTAMSIDVSNRLADSMLPFALFVVGLSFLLLMMVFRSIWVPLKAALGYLLSVGGAFGATQLVFNEGWFGWLVNLSETRPVISFLPIFGMGILFGLAMDYEVFLTSRMREEHVHGNPNSVVDGFVHSSKVVVAAAVIMLGVFAFFVPASEGMVKPIAFCLAVGVALDAFLIRMTLGPAIMKLLGEHAWWLPKWLDRLLPTLDVEGETLANQVKLRDKFDADPPPLVARGLGAEVGSKTVFSGFDLTVNEGEVAVVNAAPQVRRALFYGLSGRVKLTSGEALIAGHVMGYESGLIRDKTLLLTAADDFGKAFPSKAKVVLIDDADRLDSSQRQTLRDAMRESLAGWVFGADPGWEPTTITNSYTTTSQLSGAGVGGNDE